MNLHKEPLVHFLILGTGLFVASSFLSQSGGGSSPEKIVITQSQITSLAEEFTRRWHVQPTGPELDGLIRERVREEVYCREALALGLDQNDAIIRHRLREKMEFLSNDVIAQAQPTDEELSEYLNAHPNRFRVQRLYTFEQVYLNPEARGDNLASDAAQLLAQLNGVGRKTDVDALGDSLFVKHSFTATPDTEIAGTFGEKFADQLSELPLAHWEGPVESGFGMHLVFISERTEGRAPELGEVRNAVIREWTKAWRLEANEKAFQELLKRYTVSVEPYKPVEKRESAEAKPK